MITMKLHDKVVVFYSKGTTTATIDKIEENRLHITSPGMGGMTIDRDRVKHLYDSKRAKLKYVSFN